MITILIINIIIDILTINIIINILIYYIIDSQFESWWSVA